MDKLEEENGLKLRVFDKLIAQEFFIAYVCCCNV